MLREAFLEPQNVAGRLLPVGARITALNAADERDLLELIQVAVQAPLADPESFADRLLPRETPIIHRVVPAKLLEHRPEGQRDAPDFTHAANCFPAQLDTPAI